MNQTQRDHLIKLVERTYKKQRDELDERKPKPPSLNNYLIAAVLDGSFQLQTSESIREHIRDLVLELGPDGAFIDRDHYRYGKREDDESRMVSLSADELFVLPKSYQQAEERYCEARTVWDKERDQLEEYKETIILKIQIGSPQVLAKLIEQVDNLADLNIVNTNLLLTTPEPKQLRDGK